MYGYVYICIDATFGPVSFLMYHIHHMYMIHCKDTGPNVSSIHMNGYVYDTLDDTFGPQQLLMTRGPDVRAAD